MDEANPYSSPESLSDGVPRPSFHVRSTLSIGWRIFSRNASVIVAVVATVWLPIEVATNYADSQVFGPEGEFLSFQLSLLLSEFVGIISVAAVISVAESVTRDEAPG